MQFLENYAVKNLKEKENYSGTDRYVFTDENGKIFRSFIEMTKHSKYGEYFSPARTGAQGGDPPHFINNFPFLFSSGVSEFLRIHRCYWLLDMIHSYYSTIHFKFTPKIDYSNGKFEYIENNGCSSTIVFIYFQKTGKNKGVFCIEDEDEKGCFTRIYQEVHHTDIDVDSVEFNFENANLFLPEEY